MVPVVVAAASVPVGAGEPRSASYPQYQGPDGNFKPVPATVPLVDDPSLATMHWNGPHNMGIGKTGSKHLRYNYDANAQSKGLSGRNDLIHGGANSSIVAEGKVFVSYFHGKPPHSRIRGQHLNAPDTFFAIRADDVLVALDAGTGEVVWKTVEENGGVQVGGGKRYNWHCSPAYAKGRVFTINPLEQVRCYDAKTGHRLWQTEANPKLTTVVADRLKTLEPMGYNQAENGGIDVFETSLMVVDDAVVTPIGKVYDADTGDLLWSDKDRLLGAHYTFWRHGGKSYILTISGREPGTLRSHMRLIVPRTGELLWSYPVFPQSQPPLFLDDTCIALVNESGKLPGSALPAGLKLSPDREPELLWQLPDTVENAVGYGAGPGVIREGCVGDGIAVLMVRGISKGRYTYPKEKIPATVPRNRIRAEIERLSRPYRSLERKKHFMIVRLEDGRIMGRIDNEPAAEKILGFGSYFLDRTHLLLLGDTRHSGRFFSMQYYRVDPDSGDWTFLGWIPIGATPITGYHTTMESPVVDGNLYMRTYHGVARYDFRRPGSSRVFSVRLAGAAVGPEHPDLLLSGIVSMTGDRIMGLALRPADRGGSDPAGTRALPVDTADLAFSRGRLNGRIETPLRVGQTDRNRIELDLRRSDAPGGWTGTWRRTVPAWADPVEVSGKVAGRQTAAQPGSTMTVFTLPEAIAAGDKMADPAKRHTVDVTLVHRGDRLEQAHARSGRLNTAIHEVAVDAWTATDSGIRATLTVIFHDDVHYHHNPETNGPSVARYTVDVRRTGDGRLTGTYAGEVGIAFERIGKPAP